MVKLISGLHHVTSGVGPAQEDIQFFAEVIGQRMVKQTVLFDGDLPIYHLYYANFIENTSHYPQAEKLTEVLKTTVDFLSSSTVAK